MDRSLQVALWEAINEYTGACGGDTSERITTVRRQVAVAKVEEAIRGVERAAVSATLDEALNSGDGSYKP